MGDALPPPPPPGGAPTGSAPEPIAASGTPSTPFPPPPPATLTHPPGYVAYATAPTPTAQVSRIGGLTRWMTGLVAAAGLISVLSIILLFPVIGKASDFIRGDISQSEFEDSYATAQLVQGLQSVIGIAAGVVTIMWMYRIASNLRAHSRNTTFAPLLSIFSWLLPPFLHVLPFLVLRELWKASDPDATHGTDEWRRSKVDPLLWVWFVVYGVVPAVITAIVTIDTVDSLIGTGVAGASDPAVAAETLDSTGTLTLVSGGLTGFAAIIWILFASRLAARHMTLTGETRN